MLIIRPPNEFLAINCGCKAKVLGPKATSNVRKRVKNIKMFQKFNSSMALYVNAVLPVKARRVLVKGARLSRNKGL